MFNRDELETNKEKTMTQLEQAKALLFGVGSMEVKNIKLFPGSSRDTTAEEFAKQINNVITSMLNGDAEEVDFCD